jgi:hypothetical protein
MTFTSDEASNLGLRAQPVECLPIFQHPVDKGIPAEAVVATLKAKSCFAVGGFDCGSRYCGSRLISHNTAPLDLASIVITLDLEPRQGI